MTLALAAHVPQHLRISAARAAHQLADRLTPAALAAGDPSPCHRGYRLLPDPSSPGSLLCPEDGREYPAVAR